MRKLTFIILTLVCLAISPFASSLPDGLETVLEGAHLETMIKELEWPIMADYSVSMLANPLLQSWAAGLSGILIISFILLSTVVLKQRRHLTKA